MLSEKDIAKIRSELDNCQNPLFIFDDDPDGLASFLLLYRYVREGHGVVCKSKPTLNSSMAGLVERYSADKVFILDVPVVEQDFVDACGVPVIWIDHHTPVDLNGVSYFNPRLNGTSEGTCTTRMCYQVTEDDIWIAAVGCVGDWLVPDFIDEFLKDYSWMVEKKSDHPGALYFDTTLGRMVRVFSYILKGKTSEVSKCFKIMTRIDDPKEIMEQTTAQGKFVYKKFDKVNSEYEALYKDATKDISKDRFLIFIYPETKTSFTSDLSNELIYRYPDKVVMVGREKNGDVRMSIRSTDVDLPGPINEALNGLTGYGGGHEHACGVNVSKEDFDEFISRLRTLL